MHGDGSYRTHRDSILKTNNQIVAIVVEVLKYLRSSVRFFRGVGWVKEQGAYMY